MTRLPARVAKVCFPQTGDGRSTQATGASIVAESLREVAADLADRAARSTSWRTDYIDCFAGSTWAAVDAEASHSIAERGVQATYTQMSVDDGGDEQHLSGWLANHQPVDDTGLDRELIVGQGAPVRELIVAYRGRLLAGDALQAQLQDWTADGIVEPSFADAIGMVIANPHWLSMPGHRVVLLGAAAAIGPLEQLAMWGADVVAVDVPVQAVQDHIRSVATRGAGTVTIPVTTSDQGNNQTRGLDLAGNLAEARQWLAQQWGSDARPVLSTNAYADGGAHVCVNVAADVLAADLIDVRPEATLAYLNTPTDSFLVPPAAVAQSRRRATQRRWNGPAHRVLYRASGRRLMKPQYARLLVDDTGREWGASDTLVHVQGHNYALAKRLQRWRATLHHSAGGRVSSTVAPASWTRSVTRNKVLAATYAGAGPFGIEIFDPATTRALMAAKLVADVFVDRVPDRSGEHPESIFTAAAHGGLWRQPFEPRSGLVLAAALGAPSLLRRS